MRRWLIWGGVGLGIVAFAVNAAAAAAYLYDDSRADTIARGVTVAGVQVGGLTASQARVRLQRNLVPRLEQPIALTWQDKRFVVDPRRARLDVDLDRMGRQASAGSRKGSLLGRVKRDLQGRRIDATIRLQAEYSPESVRRFVDGVAAKVRQPARPAAVVANSVALRVIPSHTGVAVRRAQLARLLKQRLVDPQAQRTLEVPTKVVEPPVTTDQLPRKYPAFITVSRETYTLRLFRGLKLAKTYRIAVGRAGLETPAGLYRIYDKQVNPWWHVPKSAWAGDLAGRVIPPGPQDPIKARWMGFYNGAGIHGTDDIGSLGSAASHGCLRMAIPDVEELYELVPYGTPIYVG